MSIVIADLPQQERYMMSRKNTQAVAAKIECRNMVAKHFARIQKEKQRLNPGTKCLALVFPFQFGFEKEALFPKIQPDWKTADSLTNWRIHGIEGGGKDAYWNTLRHMPGKNKPKRIYRTSKGMAQRKSFGEFCTTVYGNNLIERLFKCDFNTLAQGTVESYDIAWLDFMGTIRDMRLKLLKSFMKNHVTDTCVITFARHREAGKSGEEISALKPAYGDMAYVKWLLSKFPTWRLLDDHHYQSERVKMSQVVLQRIK